MISFWKKTVNRKEKKDLVYSMVRILAQNKGDVLYELLSIMAPYFGEGSVLSVIETESKEVVATTKEEEKWKIQYTASTVRDAKTARRYMKEEQSHIFFRSPFTSVQVIPFREIGSKSAFLLVEQELDLDPGLDRCVDVLEMAVRNRIYDFLSSKNASMDKKTLLQTRDQLILRIKKGNPDKECFLGMFRLINLDHIFEIEGTFGADRAMCEMADLIKSLFKKNSYLVAEGKVGVLFEKPAFEALSNMQDCLDVLVERAPSLEVGAVLSPMIDEVYRALYLCEKASEDCIADAVFIIRNPEEYLNTGGEIVEQIYNNRAGEEVKEAFQEKSEKESGTKKDQEKNVSFSFETGFKKMEPFECLPDIMI